jgi:hypothetical protein
MKTAAGFCHIIPLVCLMTLGGCGRQPSAPSSPADFVDPSSLTVGGDKIYQEVQDYRSRIRNLYSNRNFDQLEKEADQARQTKARFGNGGWLLFSYYDSLGCRDSEPESMWQLHDQIHQDWIKAKPESITASVAYARFLLDYAWHARGHGYADSVTTNGFDLFNERTEQASKVLNDAKKLNAKCPMWWDESLAVALGQGLDRSAYDQLFAQAKSVEPQFWIFDTMQANYLLPRWYGQPGDWEAAAAQEAQRPGGLGWEGYARVVSVLRTDYGNIFSESNASWAKTQLGFEIMRKEYPDSLEILSTYCYLACVAGDRIEAKKLFGELHGRVLPYVWVDTNHFIKAHNWAFAS